MTEPQIHNPLNAQQNPTRAGQCDSQIYNDHLHAIRCALNVSAGVLGHKPAGWQMAYQSGWRVASMGPDMSREERFTQDCMTRHLLHSGLACEQWAALVVRFAPALTHRGRMVADPSEVAEMSVALQSLVKNIPVEISQEFTGWCLLRWAGRLPQGRGTWAEWESRTNLSNRTVRQRCYDITKHLDSLDDQAQAQAKGLLSGAGLIS